MNRAEDNRNGVTTGHRQGRGKPPKVNVLVNVQAPRTLSLLIWGLGMDLGQVAVLRVVIVPLWVVTEPKH